VQNLILETVKYCQLTSVTFTTQTLTMGLTLRLTFHDNDYNYQIINSKDIDQGATEFSLKLNGETVELIKDKKNVWVEKDGNSLDPQLVQALGRSVSLRLRL
jgi:hypothetical protein